MSEELEVQNTEVTQLADQAMEEPQAKGFRAIMARKFPWLSKLHKLKKPGKHMFWAWIAYQCIKGTMTTTFIWIPLFLVWWHTHHHG